MATIFRETEAHWNFFLAIEDDLDRLSRFIEFDKRNFKCFSLEISRILLASCAEIDVVCKQISKKINPSSSADNINQYRDEIKPKFSAIPKLKVLLPRHGIKLIPWRAWNDRKGIPPVWWTAYNKIKHERDAEFHRANLQNALNAVGGLLIMVLYLYLDKAQKIELFPWTKLLHVPDEGFDMVTNKGYYPILE